ncbi:glycosyltransferase family A protein [Chryseobacterium oryzae]|uniref:Glycosyltransferase family 2 protein n=1 Tax=Chryseobacterium oryzae TaxID=2929799 RepID=A0ABY4BFT4_9FLAO|nr:glycosyltransferase family 2 protein [Chryseobacterium oryzae]UOE38014.1 glycosyltransferase family 2 protein [Chryseobacterium oryzae]
MNCLLNQSYKNIEFICVNDGSTDATLAELERFAEKDARIKIYTKENQKYAQYSKAYGQEKASGDFIFLFDHDDLIELDTIEKCYQTFLKNPKLDIVTPIVITKFTDGKVKYINNIYFQTSLDNKFEYKEFSGKQILQDTVGRYDIHIRGLYRAKNFKSFSFEFNEPLLNADEIVERLIFENAQYIGNCNSVYTHFIHPESSAKKLSLKKIDLVRTDVILRSIFKKKEIYVQRKSIFEFVAYKNLVNAIKIYHSFFSEMTKEEKMKQLNRIKNSYTELDKTEVKNQFHGLSKIYNSILLSNFSLLMSYYKFKK